MFEKYTNNACLEWNKTQQWGVSKDRLSEGLGDIYVCVSICVAFCVIDRLVSKQLQLMHLKLTILIKKF